MKVNLSVAEYTTVASRSFACCGKDTCTGKVSPPETSPRISAAHKRLIGRKSQYAAMFNLICTPYRRNSARDTDVTVRLAGCLVRLAARFELGRRRNCTLTGL